MPDEYCASLRFFRVLALRMHGVAFRRARFVDDAFEEPPNRRIRERPLIRALGVLQNFSLSLRLIQRQIRRLLQLPDCQRAFRAFVQQFHKFLVQLVDAAPPIAQVHGAPSLRCTDTSRRESPCRAASFSKRMRILSASAAASTLFAFSISETSAEPTTAASASPPSTETCPASEIPNPTAIGSCVTLRALRKSAGKSSGSASLAPVTPVREIR